MSGPSADRQAHWSRVYATRPADSVKLVPAAPGGLPRTSRAGRTEPRFAGHRYRWWRLDTGGRPARSGRRAGHGPRPLGRGPRGRAGATRRARRCHLRWIAADLLSADLPDSGFDLWHDRAVLHFLGDPVDAERYARQAARAVRSGGHAVVSGFAPDGPERCSGLAVARHSPMEIAALLGSCWTLMEQRVEQHVTPGGSPQPFAYALLRRR